MKRLSSAQQTTILLAMAMLLSVAHTVPLFADEDADDAVKRSLLWSRFMDGSGKLNVRPVYANDRQLGELAGGPLFSEQKRYRAPMQSRSGGMSLCLWKVCPAAPWLVTKRESNDY